MLFCLCTQFSYSEEPECDAGKSGNNDSYTWMDTLDISPKVSLSAIPLMVLI